MDIPLPFAELTKSPLEQSIVEEYRSKIEQKLIKQYDGKFTNVQSDARHISSLLNGVRDYAPNMAALKSIAAALYEIIDSKMLFHYVQEMAMFIKYSNNPFFDNVPHVIEFGKLVRKAAELNKKKKIENEEIPLDTGGLYIYSTTEGLHNPILGYAKSRKENRKGTFESLNIFSTEMSEILWELEDYIRENDGSNGRIPKKQNKSVSPKQFISDTTFYRQPSFFYIERKRCIGPSN